MTDKLALPADYATLLADLKRRIGAARARAVLAANAEQIALYHDLGRELLARRATEGWGARVLDRLAADLSHEFPEMRGFSARNLKYMRYFAEHCPNGRFGQQPAAQLPWFHIVVLLTQVPSLDERAWYADRAVSDGWSRTALTQHIKNKLHLREGAAITNFAVRLPDVEAKKAQAVLKDPYHFDFLDLLFYHTRLKRYVVIELKGEPFTPAHMGQLSFYLTAVDRQLKAPDDGATIGLLLCKSKNEVVAEYAVQDIAKPIGVAEYQLVKALPEPLDTNLPSVEELEAELTMESNE